MAAVVIVVLEEAKLKFDKYLKTWYNILEDDKGKSLFLLME